MSLDQMLMLPPGYWPSNRAPGIVVPGAQSATSSVAKAITGTSITDTDGNPQTVTLSVDHGTLTLASTTGLSFSVGDGTADATMTFSGSLANVNTAIATITYTATAFYYGSDTLSITTNDSSGGTDSDSIAITVASQFLTDLVAWWELTADANDSHTNALHLTNNNSVTFGADGGVFSAASSRYLSRADEALLQIGAANATIAFWAKSSSKATYNMVVSKDSAIAREYLCVLHSGLGYQISDGLGGSPTTGNVSNGVWTCVVNQYDSVNDLWKIRANNGSWLTTSATGTQITGTTEFQIGARQYVGFREFFSGNIRTVAKASRLWTDDECTEYYNGGTPLGYPG